MRRVIFVAGSAFAACVLVPGGAHGAVGSRHLLHGRASGAGGSATVGVPRFAPPREVASLNEAAYLQDVTAADVNGDRNTDVVVTRFFSDHAERVALTILGGNGKGGF